MKTYCILFSLFIAAYSVRAQEFGSYERTIDTMLFSNALNDSIHVEITLPKNLNEGTDKEYPVIYLLDRQLNSNYAYNLHTIDYLSNLQWMPSAIVVGITFPWENRNSWTQPNHGGGKADDLIQFIREELNAELKRKCPVSDFNLLIGHSRTAIFSSYALSKCPDFFNAVIASSVSNFDFGDAYQKQQFEDFLKRIDTSSQKYFYYFSVGERAYGDLHEDAVDTLNSFLQSRNLPKNFEWKYYKHKVNHQLTPGLTVSYALSDIFKEYGRRIDVCFDFAKNSGDKVPWNDYLGFYSTISKNLGLTVEPSELFYNSIASDYYNDYNGIYGAEKLDFTLEVLQKAIDKFPNDFNYYSWAGEIYMERNEFEKGNQYLNKAIELIAADATISESDRKQFLEEVESLRKE